MSIKLRVDALRIGMHVEKLDRPWLGTPFLFQAVDIESVEDIQQLKKYCDHVYVTKMPDEGAAAKVIRHHAAAGDGRPKPVSETVITRKLEVLWKRHGRGKRDDSELIHRRVYDSHAPIEEEIVKAREVHQDVEQVLDTMYEDARMGKTIDTGYAKEVIKDLVESVLRSSDAHLLLSQLKKKDRYAATHGINVCSFALAFGRHLGLDRSALKDLGLGAMLIDVGNIRIPSEILRKPEPLTPEEFDIVKQHTVFGMEILLECPQPISPEAIEVVYTHHERVDGSGYPRGLIGDRIPLFGRMVGIVDVYDAATSDRIYRSGQAPSETLNELYNLRSGKYDKYLVEQFIQTLGIYPIGSVLKCTSGEIGIVIAQNPKRRLRPKLLLVRSPENQPYATAKIVDLSLFPEGETLDVAGVVKASEHDIDVGLYLEDFSGVKQAPAEAE